MKYKRALGVTVFCVFALGIYLVAAQEVTPEPPTPIENECSPGGVLYREENQDGCPNEWYWKAGWYLAAVNNGDIPPEDMPDEFTSVLPPLDAEPTEIPTAEMPSELVELPIGSCWPHPDDVFAYQYLGPANTLGNIRGYGEGNCDRPPGLILGSMAAIYANSRSEAETICLSLGEMTALSSFQDMRYSMPPYVYYCAVR